MISTHGEIWIITGPRGVGKTRFCSHLAEFAKKSGREVKGIMCPPLFEKNVKTGFFVHDFASGESLLLAKIKKSDKIGTVTDHWSFDPKAMSWSNDILSGIEDCDLVILDELGPLEFKFGQGWQSGLRLIDKKKYALAIVVIRPDLLEDALMRWPDAKTIEIPPNLDEQSESDLLLKILSI